MKICVLGLGYIGLPTAVLFATHGHTVIGVDINRDWVETVNSGAAPFVEPGLSELLETVVWAKKFTATTMVAEADAFVIAVPTPLDNDGPNKPDALTQAVIHQM